MTAKEIAEIKMQCLELTKHLNGAPDMWIATARKLSQFVLAQESKPRIAAQHSGKDIRGKSGRTKRI